MASKTVTVKIHIKAEGSAGSGKTLALDSIIQNLSHGGALQSLRRDDDNHSAELCIRHTVWLDNDASSAATKFKGE